MLRFRKYTRPDDSPLFSVTFMLWKTFFKRLMGVEKWNVLSEHDVLSQHDCIIGGADMSVSYV
jgi:hypothetical protein